MNFLDLLEGRDTPVTSALRYLILLDSTYCIILTDAQDPAKRIRKSIRITWENYPDHDFRSNYVGDRDPEGYWIKRAACDVQLVCRQYFRYRLLRLDAHINCVHLQERSIAATSQKLDKWFRSSCGTDDGRGSTSSTVTNTSQQ